MAADINSFVVSVVKEACDLLQLQDTVTNTPALFDSRVNVCARQAYNQISMYVGRSLILDSFKENYHGEDAKIALRNYPITSVNKVVLIDDENIGILTDQQLKFELIPEVDYVLLNNKSIVLNMPSIFSNNSDIKRTLTFLSVYVEYIGGFFESKEDNRLHEALIVQTVANYNRLPFLGISEISAGSAVLKKDSPGESLIESVRWILDPFVYYGSAEDA